jgi:PAS domain S-box-containing protein
MLTVEEGVRGRTTRGETMARATGKKPATLWRQWLSTSLFEQSTGAIAVIDRDLNIVENNQSFVDLFGQGRSHKCFQIFKKRSSPCESCATLMTFADGLPRVNEEIGVDRLGKQIHYIITITPIFDGEGKIPFIVEMATDISGAIQWQKEYQNLFEGVPCSISILDREHRILNTNPRFKIVFGEPQGRKCFEVYKWKTDMCRDCPAEATFRDGGVHTAEQEGRTREGRPTYYIVRTSPLTRGQFPVDKVMKISLDITPLRTLQQEKIEAERLVAVGQTVASLAHGIKNILMGLEGGMYIMSTGIRMNKPERLTQGWEILERNIGKIATMAKNLLGFSKGRQISTNLIRPQDVAREVFDLFNKSLPGGKISLLLDIDESILPAPFDPDELHSALTNLVSNALDACRMSDRPTCTVQIRCHEVNDSIVFQVTDQGCGMDYEIKQRVFTTFFTTKGAGGTGIGLLTTRKIVQEHGGRIEFESNPGEGSNFRLLFPRERLPKRENEAESSEEKLPH